MSLKSGENSKQSLLNQWRKKKKAAGQTLQIPKRPKDKPSYASSGQERLWLLQQLHPENIFYQYGHVFQIQGSINIEYLTKAVKLLANRHELLTANFQQREEGIIITNVQTQIPVTFKDISSDENPVQKSKTLAKEFTSNTVNLSQDPLFSCLILKLKDNLTKIVFAIHHIIGDRQSLKIIQDDLIKNYSVLKTGQEVNIDSSAIQYADYAYWQKTRAKASKDFDYWLNKLEGELPILNLPRDRKRPKTNKYQGATSKLSFSVLLSNKIRRFAKDNKITNFVILLAAFKILLARLSNQTDILVGSPFSTRDKSVLEKLIGFFNETLVLRSAYDPKQSFRQFVEDVKATTMEALQHRNVSFNELVKSLNPVRQNGINPLFQAMFLYNNFESNAQQSLDLNITQEVVDLEVSKFDLTLFIEDDGNVLSAVMEYSTAIFDEDKIRRFLQYFENLLDIALDQPDKTIGSFSFLSSLEKQKLLVDWNNTSVLLPENIFIPEYIRQIAEAHPNNTSVSSATQSIDYQTLEERANEIAQVLIKAGVKKNQTIGLYTNRSLELVIGILAILKSGAAYLPLDPNYPKDRIDYMLKDSDTNIILCQQAIAQNLDDKKYTILAIETIQKESKEYALPKINSEDLAYLIYTSGSTGKPKAVMINHGNLLHSTLARQHFYPSNPTSFLLLSSFSFDSSVVGIFWTLISGGNLVLPPHRIEQDVQALGKIIDQYKVTHTLMLPSLYTTILKYSESEKLASLKNVMVAGEACPLSLPAIHYETLPNCTLYNEYGPTEASVWCIAHKIEKDEKRFIPIGKPIPNAKVYILDQELQPVPIGVSGALYIGGKGVAPGYYKRQKLTEERFIINPFAEHKNEKIYRTGDLARHHKDGRIEFLGREDQQVKIRGFRIEPEEIQKIIKTHPQVNDALVVIHAEKTKPKKIVAFVTGPDDSELDHLRDFLQGKLPEYMLPAIFMQLNEFPRLPNGKINRSKLPAPDLKGQYSSDKKLPTSQLEKQLLEIWQSILGIQNIGIEENFFAIGGDSILSIQVVSAAREKNIPLDSNHIFEYQTIATLAKSLESSKNDTPSKVKIPFTPSKKTQYPLTDLQKAFYFNSQSKELDQGILNLNFSISGAIDFELFQNAWQKSLDRHSAFRSSIYLDQKVGLIQRIAKDASLDWEFLDWKHKHANEVKDGIKALAHQTLVQPLPLESAPISKMHLIQLDIERYQLIWTCHHILLDGWSCGVILNDALKYYQEENRNSREVNKVIPGFIDYLEWKKSTDSEKGISYWQNALINFEYPLLFENAAGLGKSESIFINHNILLNPDLSNGLTIFCTKNEITLSTLFQGLWAIILGKYFNSDDVLFGNTQSGRSANFPHIGEVAGLFMNIIPNRIIINKVLSIADFFKKIQKEQGSKNVHESADLSKIQEAIDWPKNVALFDALFVYGNFLKDGLTVGNLAVTDFEGGFTSAYPLTIRINPSKAIGINIRYQQGKVNADTVDWISKSLELLAESINDFETANVLEELLKILPPAPSSTTLKSIDQLAEKNIDLSIGDQSFKSLSTVEQLKLLWQNVLNLKDIKTTDKFFDLGGKSLAAIQLFSLIETKMQRILTPALLFQYPSIESLAAFIDGETIDTTKSDVLIPLKAEGEKTPLFCVHAGGGHVFFFQDLAKNLPKDQPVYTIQPLGLDGKHRLHESIEEMAAHYIKAIKQVQPQGPYQLLGTCFSNSVVLEMSHQLKKTNDKVSFLTMIDSAPVHLFGNDPDTTQTWKNFADLLKRGDFSRIKRKIENRLWKKPVPKMEAVNTTAANENLRKTIDAMNDMYARYDWKPTTSRIHFIRSAEFSGRRDKNYHLQQWKKLAAGGLEVHVVPGHHISLFEEPEVHGLAKKINACLEVINN